MPLKDLLTKNLDDRIQDYLNKMEGLTVDEIVKGGSLQHTPRKTREDETIFGTAKQQQIVDQTRSQANALAKSK